MNQGDQIKLIALLPAQWTLSGTWEKKKNESGEYIAEFNQLLTPVPSEFAQMGILLTEKN